MQESQQDRHGGASLGTWRVTPPPFADPETHRDNGWFVSSSTPESAPQSLFILQTATRRVSCPSPHPLLYCGKKSVAGFVLPSWSSPLKIFILRRKCTNVTLTCMRQIPYCERSWGQMVQPRLWRLGPSPHRVPQDSVLLKSHIKLLRGWLFLGPRDGPGGLPQPIFCHHWCWRALLGDTRETSIELFLSGSGPLFPRFDNTNQMSAGKGQACPRERRPAHTWVQPGQGRWPR